MEGKTMKRIMLFISLLWALFMSMPLQAQTINQKGVTYRYNGKNKRTPIGGVYIKPITAANGVVSDESSGAFTLALDNLKMGSRIGNVRVTKQGMMVFNQQAVDEWSVRKDPLCLILCNADEFQKQKKNLIAIGESQAKKKYDKKLAELKKQNDAQQLKIDEYYNKLDSLEDEYQNALKHMDEYADVFARIDESEVDTVAQRAIEMFNRGEIEESIHLLEQQNYMEKIKQANRTIEQADAMISTAEQAKSLAEQDRQKYLEGIKTQIAGYKLQNEWDKAKELLKGLADNLNTLEAIGEYANFCYNQLDLKDAEAYYLKYETKARSSKELSESEMQSMIANAQNDLANLYYNTQRFTESEEMHKSALAIRERLAKDNPQVCLIGLAVSYNNLGVLYKDTQRFTESEEMYKSALAICEQLAMENPQTYEPYVAKFSMNMAEFYYFIKRYKESETMYMSALDKWKLLAKSNPLRFEPDLAMTLMNLGVFYKSQMRYSESEAMQKSALEIRNRLSKSNPYRFEPDLAMSLMNLGALYYKQMRYTESETMLKTALEIYERLDISNTLVFDESLAMTQANLANLFFCQKKYLDSEKMYNASLKTIEKSALINPSKYDSFIAHVFNGMALLYNKTNRVNKSEEMRKLALEILKRLAAKNPSVYDEELEKTLSSLICIYEESQRYAECEKTNKICIETCSRLYKQQPKRYKTTYADRLLAQAFYCDVLGRYKEAINCSRMVLSLDSTFTNAYINLAAAMLFNGNFKEAEKIYKKYKSEFGWGLDFSISRFERLGVIPEERKKDVERIKAMLNEE